jgi:hypothetical protein
MNYTAMKYLILVLACLPLLLRAQDTSYWHVVEGEILSLQTPYVEFQRKDTIVGPHVFWKEDDLRKTILDALIDHAKKQGREVVLREEDFINVINDIVNGADRSTKTGISTSPR